MCYGCRAESAITPISHSPGIYFEPIYNIRFYNDHWNVVTHINIISLEPYLNNSESLLRKIHNLCEKLQEQDIIQCKDFSSPIEILIQSNLIKSQSLSHLIVNKSPTKVKRSLEFGGEILKFFFGTLDADDARKYDAAIESCQKSETEMYRLMKDNIHIVQSTIHNFNSSLYKLNQNEVKLNSQINIMNEILSQVSKTDNLLYHISHINSLLNILESSLISISNILDTTLNAILFSKVNVLHPSVISPISLFNELYKQSIHISKRLDFPVELSLNNIHSIIDVSQLSSYYYNNKIIFVLQIPLISENKYIMYKNIPLPTPHSGSHNKTFALIQPSSAYTALSEDRLHYTIFNNLNDCKTINSEYSICKLQTIYSCILNPSCESKLLTEVILTLPEECNSRFMYGHIDIWHKLKNNRWIFVQSHMLKLNIKCDNDVTDYSILGTGYVKLAENCIGYSKTIQLIPSFSKSFEIKSSINIDFDITADDCCSKEKINKTLPYLSPISLTKINLDSLQYSSHKLDNLENELNNLETQSHFVKYGVYYSSFTYFLIISIFLFLAYKVYKCCRKNRSSSDYCIQIFNQCNNKKIIKHKSKISNSIEMNDISTSDDDKSVKSLPAPRHSSQRNLNF